ncbi:uncharacterized protein LOC123564204 [Mercenaria mercenaria]|uniref:uncharacterized protein LOC123564204 n=1 Tax=Mercenaria mercenaria TaxID=6596 RepID=UPI00234EE9E8|nr:uncharacterized protein LOC123564204 [Mercenaria mercenaria]
MMKTLKRFTNVANPYKISFLEQFDGEYGNVYNGLGTKRFLFVRNPYDRLLSGYVDKLLAPNPVYWKLIGIPAIKHSRANPSQKSLLCGHDLTFKEYIKYVIFALGGGSGSRNRRKSRRRVGVGHDLHFATLTEVSKPCHIKYDFVGKMETFAADSIELVRQLNLSETEQILTLNGSEMAADDAIQDTTYQPFHTAFRSDMLKCMTPLEALNRSWQKLQIRGLIGNHDLEMTAKGVEELSYSDFLHMARTARNASTKKRRRKLKKSFYNQFYESIPAEMLQNLTVVYKDDFELFGYNSKPTQLFHNT